jgi:hypothetical protein
MKKYIISFNSPVNGENYKHQLYVEAKDTNQCIQIAKGFGYEFEGCLVIEITIQGQVISASKI